MLYGRCKGRMKKTMASNNQAKKQAYMPAGTEGTLNARDLQTAHKRLAKLIQPGVGILDVGWGTGSNTCGLAKAVGPGGFVLGLDDNPTLIDQATRMHRGLSNIAFEVENIHTLGDYETGFEILWLPGCCNG